MMQLLQLSALEVLVREVVETDEGKDELKIPAIWSVGGWILRFIDSANGFANCWEVDLRPVETPGVCYRGRP